MGELWPFLLGLLSLGVGLHHLFLSWLRPTERAYLSFGFGAIAFGTHTLLLTPSLTGPIDNLAVSHRLAAIAGHAALVALLLLVWRSLDRPVQRPLRLYLASHGFLVLFLLVAPFRWVFAIDPARLGSMVPGLAAAPLLLVAADRRATSRLVLSSWQWASSCSPDWGGGWRVPTARRCPVGCPQPVSRDRFSRCSLRSPGDSRAPTQSSSCGTAISSAGSTNARGPSCTLPGRPSGHSVPRGSS